MHPPSLVSKYLNKFFLPRREIPRLDLLSSELINFYSHQRILASLLDVGISMVLDTEPAGRHPGKPSSPPSKHMF
jgi:hypothetical protein